MRLRLLLTLVLCLPLVAADRRHAPDPQVDYTHLALDIDMRPSERAFDAVEVLTFTTLAVPIERLTLDAVGMTVGKVEGEHVASFRHDGGRLTIEFDGPLPPRSEHEVVIEYAVLNPVDGMTFALPDEAYPDRPIMVHTQGQPESNRHWVICHDYPNERMTTEMRVRVPDGLKVLANGERLSPRRVGFSPPSDPSTRPADGGLKPTLHGNVWHYRMNKPHVSYLMSLVVGEFDVVRDGDWRGRRIEYWVPPGRADDAERTFGRTHHMLDFFSDKLGEYPWEAYSQSVVYLFGSGGMENTTVTTMFQDCIVDERAAIGSTLDGLVAHELAHQWFGDHTTCEDWSHLWLNEGFATFLDHAWHEAYHGPEEYAHEVFTNMRRVAENADATAEYGLIFPAYDDPGETFRRRVSNPYGKGSAVIHMLRQSVGDDAAFWEALKLFQEKYALEEVDSDDLRECFEATTGRDYGKFFEQWVVRAGVPKLDVSYEYDSEAKAVRLRFEQTQEGEPFEHDLPVWTVAAGGEVTKHVVPLRGKTTDATLATPGGEPDMVCLDPLMSMLSVTSFDPPRAMTLRQATNGPTAFSRLKAIERMGESDDPSSAAALRAILDDAEAHWGQQAEAARSLGKLDTDVGRAALLASVETMVDHPRARLAAVEAVGEYRDADVADILLTIAGHNASLYVEAAACVGLGNQKPTDEVVGLLVEKTNDAGHGLRVRQAAVGALAKLGVPEALQPALDLAAYGTSFRARGGGIDALAVLYPSLDDDQKEDVRDFLLDLADDPQERHARGAMLALGRTGDKEAVDALRRVADSARLESVTDAARDAVTAIETGDPEVVRALRDRLDRLEEAFDAERAERREKAREGRE